MKRNNDQTHRMHPPSFIAFEISLNAWLKQRQALMIQVNQLCQLRPFKKIEDPFYLEMHVLSFCQTLLDYISLGQLKLLDRMMAEIQKSPYKEELPQNLFKDLKETALIALKFSDRCAHQVQAAQLEYALGQLTEKLAYRFDLEDDLIKLYSQISTKTKIPLSAYKEDIGSLRN